MLTQKVQNGLDIEENVVIQVIFLDDLGVNVKAAQRMGMHTILVKDIPTALKQLSEATGVDVHSEKENLTAKI